MKALTPRRTDPLATLDRAQQEAVVRDLARLTREHDGTLTPPVVVDAARPAEAPLHPAFEWDDAVAAERFREHQARQVIRSVRVVVSGGDDVERPQEVQAFVGVDAVGDQASHFVPLPHVAADPALRARMVELFLVEVEQLLERFAIVPALRRMLEEMRDRVKVADQALDDVATDVPAEAREAEPCAIADAVLPSADAPDLDGPRQRRRQRDELRRALLRPLSTSDIWTVPKLWLLVKDHMDEARMSTTVQEMTAVLEDLSSAGLVGVTTSGLERAFRGTGARRLAAGDLR